MPSPPCVKQKQKACQEKLSSVQLFVHIISMFNGLWMPTEATETCIYKLSMGLQKLKLDKTMSISKNNTFMVSVRPSGYGCTLKVAKHLKG